jgi:hypothetical protein
MTGFSKIKLMAVSNWWFKCSQTNARLELQSITVLLKVVISKGALIGYYFNDVFCG